MAKANLNLFNAGEFSCAQQRREIFSPQQVTAPRNDVNQPNQNILTSLNHKIPTGIFTGRQNSIYFKEL
jgi:hypothetical protein